MKKVSKFILAYIISWVLIAYTYTFGIFTGRGRGLVYYICCYFNLARFTNTKAVNIPLVSISELIENKNITLYEPVYKMGNVSINELAALNGIIEKKDPHSIFEIGTFDGRTTLNMAMSSSNDCEIFTINLSPEEDIATGFEMHDVDKDLAALRFESGIRFSGKDKTLFPQVKKIKQLYGDSAKFDFSPYFSKIDLVFIDAAHSYDYVINDSEIALKLLRGGKGILLWHDYRNGCDVVEAIDSIKDKYKHLKIFHIKDTDLAYAEIS